jgi:hypothetical protein
VIPFFIYLASWEVEPLGNQECVADLLDRPAIGAKGAKGSPADSFQPAIKLRRKVVSVAFELREIIE